MINGIKGGLVLGNSHCDIGGGVKFFDEHENPCMLYYTSPGNIKIPYQKEMQGGEYLINPLATTEFHDRLVVINNSIKDNFFTFYMMLTTAKRIIDCRDINQIIIFSSGQFVINRQATIDNIQELEEINEFGQEQLL